MGLIEALAGRGASFPKLSYRRSVENDMGNGVFAEVDFKVAADTTLAFIPQSCILHRTTVLQLASKSPALRSLRICLEDVQEQDMLDERRAIVIFLMFMKHFKPEEDEELAFWKDYVSCLPQHLDTPLFFDRDSIELELLSSTTVESALISKTTKIEAEYSALEGPLSLLGSPISIELFKWADGIFWSRVLSFHSAPAADGKGAESDDMHMIPFIDFANHSFTPQLRWQVTPEGCELRAFADLECTAGQELFISYGEKPNVELLFIHGFAIEDNPHDSMTFPAPLIEAGAPEDDEPSQASLRNKVLSFRTVGLRPMVQVKLNGSVFEHTESNSASLWTAALEELTRGRIDADSMLTCLLSIIVGEDELGPTLTDGTVVLGGQRAATKADIYRTLSTHPLWEVLLLRVWTVFGMQMDAHLDDLKTVDAELEEATAAMNDVKLTEDAASSPPNSRLKYVKVMRKGHRKADEVDAGQKASRTFRKYTYRGVDLEQLLDMSSEQLVELVHARARRRFQRGLKRKPMGLIKKLRKAKKEAPELEKPECVKTHLRNMIIVPEMVGSVVGVYNGKVFNQIEIKPEMIGHYLGEFSLSYKPVKHGRPGIGATHSSRFIPLK
ncbi:ribosomal protein S15 [Phlyctochytrium bullatum]|nr:ribosomal protein S15 [Phlyctochytrium bullatum]